jgi:hypothetical protein
MFEIVALRKRGISIRFLRLPGRGRDDPAPVESVQDERIRE